MHFVLARQVLTSFLESLFTSDTNFPQQNFPRKAERAGRTLRWYVTLLIAALSGTWLTVVSEEMVTYMKVGHPQPI